MKSTRNLSFFEELVLILASVFLPLTSAILLGDLT